MKRRDFLKLSGAAIASSVLRPAESSAADAPKKSGRRVDPGLAVFMSDLHVWGGGRRTFGPYPINDYPREHLDVAVNGILAMDPLPATVFVPGDISWLYGDIEDYRYVKPVLGRLEEAGVRLVLGMGNHDRRETFFETWTQYAETTPVKGAVVTRVDAGPCDFIMLDSLHQPEKVIQLNQTGPYVAGVLDDAQQQWLEAEIAKIRKPTYLMAHHPASQLKVCGRNLADIIRTNPNLPGFIHGHDHFWRLSYFGTKWESVWVRGDGTYNFKSLADFKRQLCLPSVSNWGDIGYVTCRIDGEGLLFESVLNDFYGVHPVPKEKRPCHWDAIRAEHNGLKCHMFHRPWAQL